MDARNPKALKHRCCGSETQSFSRREAEATTTHTCTYVYAMCEALSTVREKTRNITAYGPNAEEVRKPLKYWKKLNKAKQVYGAWSMGQQ